MRRNRRRRGIAAVEFALVAIPLFLLLIGLIDYGFLFLAAQQVTQAARSGVRAAIVADATNESVQNAITASLAAAGITTFTYTPTPSDVSAVAPGAPIEIELTVPTSQLDLIRASIVPVPANLHAAASMAKEG